MNTVSMPHAALWVVQQTVLRKLDDAVNVSMPHAALWVVQPQGHLPFYWGQRVSMPHAALWVVQLLRWRARVATP